LTSAAWVEKLISLRGAAAIVLIILSAVAMSYPVAASDTSIPQTSQPQTNPNLVYHTDFENATKRDAYTLNIGIDHSFDLKDPGAAMWVEGLDRQTPGVTCHSGKRCIGMEITNITQSVRNEFNIINLQNLVGNELYVSVWLYLPPNWSLHNYLSPSHNWDQIINPFFTDGPTYLPYASFNIIQPNPNNTAFDVRLDYRDVNLNSITLQDVSNYPLPRGTWFNVQYYVYRSVTSGIIRVWINGVLTFNAANVSTENPSTASWFTTIAKIYYDANDKFSPYQTWVDDLEIYNALPQAQPQPQTLTTSVASGSGSVNPDCSAVCSEAVGSSISETASAPSGWAFSSWSINGASCSGGSSSNPCTFTMPSNAVTVSATFTQIPPSVQSLFTGVDSGQGNISPNCAGGCSEAVGSSITVQANPGSAWQFSSWSTQSGVSCSSNPCAFNMPNQQVTLKATFTQNPPSTQTLTTSVASGQGTVNPNCPAPSSCQETVGQMITVTGTASSGWQFSSWSVTGASCSGGASSDPCTFTVPNNAVTISATFTPVSSQTVTMTVSYSIAGGGSPTAPSFTYIQNGATKTLKLTKTATTVTVDSGSTWSISPNPLGGSSSTARWASNQLQSGTASSVMIVFAYYHQYWTKVSFSVTGGSGYSPPVFQSNLFGSPTPVTLTNTASGYWFDAGSPWTVSNPLTGSTAAVRWFTTQKTGGTLGGSASYAFSYQHQYYATIVVPPSGAGSVSPGSNWYNAGQRLTIRATAKTGHKFLSWTGTGAGSYSGNNSSATITMNSAITETANFT
jgi:hypothetical protein